MSVISQIFDTYPIPVGEHTMTQPLPSQGIDQLSPYLLIHHHGPYYFEPNNGGLPFGPHPHRGFETLSLVLEGDIYHKDSEGFEGIVNEGGVQWMTAGSGIVHSENLSPKMLREGGNMHFIQIWMNLPAALKMTAPSYQDFQKADIPVVKSTDSEIQVISGRYFETLGVAKSLTNLDIFNVKFENSSAADFEVFSDKNALIYVYEGSVEVENRAIQKSQMLVFENLDQTITVKSKGKSGFIFLAGKPINEPMVAHGPFVMNTQAEIQQAHQDYYAGKFGRM